MISRMFRARACIRRFLRNETGSSTVEFCILLPAFLALFISSYEAGLLMVRNVMLERGVDLAVRDLRLGTPEPPTFEEFKQSICDNSLIIANCNEVIQVELRPVSTTTWAMLDGPTNCIETASEIDPIDQTEYSVGTNNELMLVRVCSLFDPLFGTTGFAMRLPMIEEGKYALVATSAFVNEPSR